MNLGDKVAVLGAGAWGTALALAAARADHEVVLWGRDEECLREMGALGVNSRYLPGIDFDAHISATADLAGAVAGAGVVLLATPAQTVAGIAGALGGLVPSGASIVCCAKGIDRSTGRLPTQSVADRMSSNRIAALSGPSFATDVARHLPTAVTVAASSADLASSLATFLSSAHFRCYASDDLLGVELGGALKNVIALAVGAARGMELGASAEAALIARGFAEMTRLAVALGARRETLAGLSGLGDLVLTASSTQSRNFVFGNALGKGESVAGYALAEGAFTAGIAARISSKLDVDTPIIDAVDKVLENSITPRQAVRELLERPLRQETG